MSAQHSLATAVVVALFCGLIYLAVTEIADWRAAWLPTLLGSVVGLVFYHWGTSAQREVGIHWGHGLVAAGIVGGFLLAQAVSQLSPAKPLSDEAFHPNEESALISLASDIALARSSSGETLDWPEGMTLEYAAAQGDFPPDVWSAAQAEWNRMPPEEQQGYQRLRAELVTGYHQLEVPTPWRKTAFSLGWSVLAMVLAFVPASRLILFPSSG